MKNLKFLVIVATFLMIVSGTTCKKAAEEVDLPIFVISSLTGPTGSNGFCNGVPCNFRQHFRVKNIGASGNINVTVTTNNFTETKSFAVQSNTDYRLTVQFSWRSDSGEDTITVRLPGLTLTRASKTITSQISSTMEVITE